MVNNTERLDLLALVYNSVKILKLSAQNTDKFNKMKGTDMFGNVQRRATIVKCSTTLQLSTTCQNRKM